MSRNTNQTSPKHEKLFQNSTDRRQLLKSIGALGFATTLAGCGGNSGGSEGNAFELSVNRAFEGIDPATETGYVPIIVRINAYDHLVMPDAEGNIQPHLAEDWDISNGGKTYTFTLRDNATFHSGNDVTAEDVKFSMERFLDINQGFSSLFADYLSKESISVEDEKTVSFELNQVYSPFLATLVTFAIVDKDVVMDNQGEGEFGDRGDYGQSYLNQNTAGSGPYELTDFDPESAGVFERFEDYWKSFPDNPFDTVRVEVVTQDSTVQSLMRQGELDMTSHFEAEQTYDALESMDGVGVVSAPAAELLNLKINVQKPPVDDRAVREAMAWGFDYDQAVNDIADAAPALGPLPTTLGTHTDDIPAPEYDPEKARRILSDAGYEDGDISISHTYVDDELREKIGLLFQENMSAIGIDVEVTGQPFTKVADVASSDDPTELPHVTSMYYSQIYPSPDAFFYDQYYSGAPNSWANMERLNDDQVDNMVEEARAEVDPEARAEIYRELQNRVASLYANIHVFSGTVKHGLRDSVGGYTYRPAESFDYWFHSFTQQ
jgi:peptide/nickel transport system substrate-binding protein